MDASTSASWITVKYDEVDGGVGKLVEKLLKIRKTSKAWKIAKVIGLEECLPKHQSSVN